MNPCEKAGILVESIPYIKQFRNEIVVVKYGGNAMIDEELKQTVIEDIVLMKYVGMNPVIVHGGGPEINALMEKMGKEPVYVNGLRVTDAETMTLVEMALLGKINSEIVGRLNQMGVLATGISGKDGRLLVSEARDPALGLVGKVKEVRGELIHQLLNLDYVPVVAPVGIGASGESYNINADEAASRIALALNAKKLVYITNVEGVLESVESPGSLLSHIHVDEIDDLIARGIVQNGMIPKIKYCRKAVMGGVERVHMINGNKPHALLLEIFTNDGIGTMLTR
ncbi:acetylglutamate kinase [Anoxynatronum buryatiense]|uniref:Acetylglutamate kinase n=1 Tax=Anoxynatronum buryatiense TaxID=489973 RepID=A0AA45WU50_9CLOT|nr:acetylglutamate kinase [Anoxynatronum buryatiense]SMP41500.1 N-acetylglutamate kinase [Anoxynatronum buryatiense]